MQLLIHQLLKDVKKIATDVQKEKHISAKRFAVSVQTKQKLIIKMLMDFAATQQKEVRSFHVVSLELVQNTRENWLAKLNALAISVFCHSLQNNF